MSPVEDEAVVQRMLLDAGIDNVVLEDATSLVPGLKFTPGISSWKVSTKAGELFSTWDDVDEKSKSQIRPYMVGCIKKKDLKFEFSKFSNINCPLNFKHLPAHFWWENP